MDVIRGRKLPLAGEAAAGALAGMAVVMAGHFRLTAPGRNILRLQQTFYGRSLPPPIISVLNTALSSGRR